MTSQSYKSTLVSLAMLKVRVDSGGNYLDNIIPFVRYVIQGKTAEEEVKAEVVQKGIEDEFGIFIPINSISLSFKRLARQRILKKDNRRYFVQKTTDEFAGFESDRAETDRHIEAVINEFVRFSQDKYEKTITEKKASEIILGFLSEFSIECLAAFEKNTSLPVDLEMEKSEQILIGSFIKNLQADSPERFVSFSQIVKGHMLANALLCPTLTGEKFGGVTFYMDTPLIIKLLGLNGSMEKTVVLEMTDILRKLKGRIAIFDHTRDEISNFIDWLANYGHQQNIHNSAAVEMRKQGKKRTEMIILKNQYVNNLREKGIHVINAPSFNMRNFEYQIDEKELEDLLVEEIQYLNNPDAVKYDVRSVRSIQVLRKTRKTDRIEKSSAVFVTSNIAFAKAIRGHESPSYSNVSYNVPSVIWDSELTNLAWLKSPVEVSQKIPEHRIISNAYTMLNPGKAFWIKVTEAVEKLQQDEQINEETLALLRADPSLIQEIYEQSLGSTDPQDISKVIKEDILNRITLDKRRKIKRLERDIQDNQDKQAANSDAIADKLSMILMISLFVILVLSSLLLLIFNMEILAIIGTIISIFAFFGFKLPNFRKKISRQISKFIKRNILEAE